MPLLPWQEPACLKVMESLRNKGVALQLSDTGSGKTYIAIEALRRLGWKGIVVCPKSVIGAWPSVAEQLGCPEVLLDVKNPEQLVRGNTPWFKENRWGVPENVALVWDEVHRGCSGVDSQQTKVLALSKAFRVPALIQSATIADSPLKLRAVGFLAGLHEFNKPSFYRWCRANGCYDSKWHRGLEFPTGPMGAKRMLAIHSMIKDIAVRLRIQDIPDFPTSSIQPLLLTLPAKETEEFQAAYAEMDDRLKKPGANELVETLRVRQRTEHLKAEALADLVDDELEAGRSVVVFVQFRDTLAKLVARFPSAPQLHGDQTPKERTEAIQAFQSNSARVIMGIMSAGGVGVSLHSGDPEHMRVAYHTPGWSASELRQAFGRVWRTGGLHSVQHIVLADRTVEQRVYKRVQNKMGCIDSLNDGDLV